MKAKEQKPTGNDVLSGGRDPGENARIRLGESFETFDELGKIVSVLDFDGDLNDGRDRELHDSHVVSLETNEGERKRREKERQFEGSSRRSSLVLRPFRSFARRVERKTYSLGGGKSSRLE